MIRLSLRHSSKVRVLRGLLCLALFELLTAGAVRAEDDYLQAAIQLCGKSALSGQVGQKQKLCNAVIGNVYAAIINGNNARVWGPVTAACLNACGTNVSGGGDGVVCKSSVPAGNAPVLGSDPCDSTVRAAWYAYHTNEASVETWYTSQANFQKASQFQGGDAPAIVGGREDQKEAPSKDKNFAALPASCSEAYQSGQLQARINCALETDPNMPSFIRDPRFATEVQQLTGQSLDQMMNADGEQLISTVGPVVMNNMVRKLNGFYSLANLVGLGMSMTSRLLDKMPSSDAAWLASRLPSPFSSLVNGLSSTPDQVIGNVPAPKSETLLSVARAPGQLQANSGISDLRDETGHAIRGPAGANGSEPENLTIFQIVSRRYSLVLGRVE